MNDPLSPTPPSVTAPAGGREDAVDRYERLREEGLARISSGRLEEAREVLREGLVLAQAHLDEDVVERAWCNICAVSAELGDTAEPVRQLGRILLQSRRRENRRFAAYHLSRAWELRKDCRKALFYARIAKEHAEELDRSDWVAAGLCQIGSLLLATSKFQEAEEELEAALTTVPAEAHLLRALIEDNLGYCYIVRDEPAKAFSTLFHCVRTIRRLGARKYETEPRLTLSYAYLVADRPRPALRHGLRALALAEEMDDADHFKTALFLLGEATKQLGHDADARDYFVRLQKKFYPGDDYLADMLLVIDARSLVNLKAMDP